MATPAHGDPRAPAKRRAAPMGGSLVLLTLFFLLTAGVPPAGAVGHAPNVLANTYGIAFGDVKPGDVLEGSFTLSNPGMAPGTIRFVQESESLPWVNLSVQGFTLAPGESRRVPFVYSVPVDAKPGHQGEAVKFMVDSPTTGPAEGTGVLAAGTAILVTSRTTAVGVTAVEAPEHILPGMSAAGRVVVVTTAHANATVSVGLRLVGLNGTIGRELRLPAANLTPNTPDATVAFPFNFTNVTLPRGVYLLEATLRHEAENATAPLSKASFAKPLTVGAREAAVEVDDLTDLGDGNATATVTLRNTGTVPITFRPKLRFTPYGSNATPVEVLLDPVTLQPGESRLVNATVTLPPGNFLLSAGSDGEKLPFTEIAETNVTFQMAPAKVHRVGFSRHLLDWLSALSILTLVGALAVTGGWAVARSRSTRPRPRSGRLRRAAKSAGAAVSARWARLRAPPAPAPAPGKADLPLTEFLADLDAGAAPEAAAALAAPTAPEAVAAEAPVEPATPTQADTGTVLLVDVAGLYGPEDAPHTRAGLAALRGHLNGADVAVANGYYSDENAEAARVAHEALRSAELAPRVSALGESRGGDARLALALDAMELAGPGRTIVMATHDAAFADLIERLRERGARVELLAVPHQVPLGLLTVVDAVRPLPSASPAPRVHPFHMDDDPS